MEGRRGKPDLFSFEQAHIFINRCSRLFKSPGTAEAEAALKAIADNGTFLLVADSLTAFVAMFPAVEGAEDAGQEPAAQSGVQAASDRTEPNPGPDASATPDVPAPQPAFRRPGMRGAGQPSSDARPSSGHPFR